MITKVNRDDDGLPSRNHNLGDQGSYGVKVVIFQVRQGCGFGASDQCYGYFSSEEKAKLWIEQSDMHPEDKAELIIKPHVLDWGM